MGLTTIFPGSVQLSSQQKGPDWKVAAVYVLNLKEKIAKPGHEGIRSEMFYGVKNLMAWLIRRVPPCRSVLTGASNSLRRMFGWETMYDDAGFNMKVKVDYTIRPQTGTILVDVDWTECNSDGMTEMVVMSEQGAHYFDQYQDSSGIALQGSKIGCWDEIVAQEASFSSMESRVEFSLTQVDGARLFRGRECIGSRLAWAGFGYSVMPRINKFSYAIKIGRYS